MKRVIKLNSLQLSKYKFRHIKSRCKLVINDHRFHQDKLDNKHLKYFMHKIDASISSVLDDRHDYSVLHPDISRSAGEYKLHDDDEITYDSTTTNHYSYIKRIYHKNELIKKDHQQIIKDGDSLEKFFNDKTIFSPSGNIVPHSRHIYGDKHISGVLYTNGLYKFETSDVKFTVDINEKNKFDKNSGWEHHGNNVITLDVYDNSLADDESV
jgi:hypothetical protein